MITNKTRTRELRLLPLFSLCLLLLGLVVACSDVSEDVAVPLNADNPFDQMEVDPFEHMDEPTVHLKANEGGAFYKDTKDVQSSTMAFLEDFYKSIKYPLSARQSGTVGKFRAQIQIGFDGNIIEIDVQPFTDEFAGGPPVSPELTVVGYQDAKTDGIPNPEILKKEIERVLWSLGDFQPALRNGKPSQQRMNLDINFILE